MVDIWRASLEIDLPRLAALEGLLSEREQEQAARFHFERDRRRYLAAHAALRAILAKYLDCPPQAICWQENSYGKPALTQPAAGLHFNLAHSHELALVAVTRLGEIGVDLEHARLVEDMDHLAQKTFSGAEVAQLNRLSTAQRQQAFFECWARKEAFIKALGEGLSHPLQGFSVTLLPGEPARLLEVGGDAQEAAQWTIRTIAAHAEYAAAFAVRATSVQLRCWNFDLYSELAYV
jgi:4'-phosphopantetheinyl transferase